MKPEPTARTSNRPPAGGGCIRQSGIVEWSWAHPSERKIQRLFRRFAARVKALCTASAP